MLIDIHTHTGRARQVTRPNGSRYPNPDELIAALDAAGIDRAVCLSTVSPECRYAFVNPEEVLDACAQFPERLIPFFSIDPRMLLNSPESDFGPLLRAYKDMGFKGIGEYLPNIPFDDPLNLNVFAHVAEAGLPLIFHIAPTIGGCYGCYDDLGLPRLERVLQACPRLVLLGHSQPFWSEISADVTPADRGGYPTGPVKPGRTVELMRRYPNLYGDLSAGSGYNAISRDPQFGYAFLEEFQDRLLFGTDIASLSQELPIVPYFHKLGAEELISREAHDKITWRNADRLLNLGISQP